MVANSQEILLFLCLARAGQFHRQFLAPILSESVGPYSVPDVCTWDWPVELPTLHRSDAAQYSSSLYMTPIFKALFYWELHFSPFPCPGQPSFLCMLLLWFQFQITVIFTFILFIMFWGVIGFWKFLLLSCIFSNVFKALLCCLILSYPPPRCYQWESFSKHVICHYPKRLSLCLIS